MSNKIKCSSDFPLMKQLFELIEKSEISYVDFSRKTGKVRETIFRWRTGKTVPSVVDFNEVLSCMGYELKIIEKNDKSY